MKNKVEYVVHIADIHLRTYQYHDLYQQQFEKLINELKNKFESVDKSSIRIVIAGDIFHQKINISNEQLLIMSSFLNGLTKIGIVIIIPGNHDFLENNMERVDSITPIVELIKNDDVIYYKDSDVYDDENIKWVVYSLYQHNQKPIFEKDENSLYIGLFHGPIQGLTTDLGFEFEDGYSKLNFEGCDVLLCGDIHKRSTFQLPNGGKGIMVGSLIQQSFGETISNHGYGIYNIENDEYEFFDIENPQPFMDFKINDIKDIEDENEQLLNT